MIDIQITQIENQAILELLEVVKSIDEYSSIQKIRLERLVSNPRKFVKVYMKVTGANQWDIPDCLLTYVE